MAETNPHGQSGVGQRLEGGIISHIDGKRIGTFGTMKPKVPIIKL